jgi:Leu/Phe-tRNA-protein transferase
MPAKKIGRPKVSKRHYKKPGFSVRLNALERREIETAIKSCKEEKSEWIRDALLSKARRRRAV